MITRFCELPIGARFEFRGRRYEKLGTDLAGDEERCGNRFHENTDVFAEYLRTAITEKPRLATIGAEKQKAESRNQKSTASATPLPYARKAACGMGARGRVWEEC